jgi:hypothetical protein
MALMAVMFCLYAIVGEKPIVYCLLGANVQPTDANPTDETDSSDGDEEEARR